MSRFVRRYAETPMHSENSPLWLGDSQLKSQRYREYELGGRDWGGEQCRITVWILDGPLLLDGQNIRAQLRAAA
jgi:hypothetical protein